MPTPIGGKASRKPRSSVGFESAPGQDEPAIAEGEPASHSALAVVGSPQSKTDVPVPYHFPRQRHALSGLRGPQATAPVWSNDRRRREDRAALCVLSECHPWVARRLPNRPQRPRRCLHRRQRNCSRRRLHRARSRGWRRRRRRRGRAGWRHSRWKSGSSSSTGMRLRQCADPAVRSSHVRAMSVSRRDQLVSSRRPSRRQANSRPSSWPFLRRNSSGHESRRRVAVSLMCLGGG